MYPLCNSVDRADIYCGKLGNCSTEGTDFMSRMAMQRLSFYLLVLLALYASLSGSA